MIVQLGLCWTWSEPRRWLEAGNFGFRRWRNCTISVAKAKALISFAVICAFVFAYMQNVGFLMVRVIYLVFEEGSYPEICTCVVLT